MGSRYRMRGFRKSANISSKQGLHRPNEIYSQYLHSNDFRDKRNHLDVGFREDIVVGAYCDRKHHKVLFKATGEIVLLDHPKMSPLEIKASHLFMGQKPSEVNLGLGTARFRCAEIRELYIRYIRMGRTSERSDIRKALPKEVREMGDQESYWHDDAKRERVGIGRTRVFCHRPVHRLLTPEQEAHHRWEYQQKLSAKFTEWCKTTRQDWYTKTNKSDFAIPQFRQVNRYGDDVDYGFRMPSPLNHMSPRQWYERIFKRGFTNAFLMEDHEILKDASNVRVPIWNQIPTAGQGETIKQSRNRVVILDAHPDVRGDGTPVLIGFELCTHNGTLDFQVWGTALSFDHLKGIERVSPYSKEDRWGVRIDGTYNIQNFLR